jgi:hypothetical protein
METIIGFVAGYIAGSRDGRDGLERLRTSWRAIRTSPEVHRLVAETVVVAESALRRAATGGLSGTVSTVSDLISSRSASRAPERAA